MRSIATAFGATLSDGGGRFLAWWVRELAGMLPARLVRPAGAPADALVAVMEPDQVRFVAWSAGGAVALGTVDRHAPRAEQAERLRAVLRRERRRLPLLVGLPVATVLRRTVLLPRAAEPQLRQVLEFRLDRLTPWSAEAVRFDAVAVGRAAGGQQVEALLTVARRDAVDAGVEWLRGLGLQPSGACVAEADGAFRRADLLGGAGEAMARRRSRGLFLGALALVVAGWSAFAGWTLFEARTQEALLRQQAAAAQTEAELVARLQAQVERLRSEAAFLDRRRAATPSAVVLIEVISALLPGDAWLSEFDLRGSELRIQGLSPDASALLPLLEASPHLSRAEFRAPTVRDPGLDAERFHIGMRVEPLWQVAE